jgi:hypothetical protein
MMIASDKWEATRRERTRPDGMSRKAWEKLKLETRRNGRQMVAALRDAVEDDRRRVAASFRRNAQ